MTKVTWTTMWAAGAICAAMAGPAMGDEAKIREALQKVYPQAEITSISPSAVGGLWEVVSGKNVVYADSSGKFLIFGDMIDADARRNLTQERKDLLSAVKWDSLPLEHAVKTIKGDGSRKFVAFEDPNCGFCKKLHQELERMDNFTMYTFLIPILSKDSRVKSESILCARDRSKALSDWMKLAVTPAPAQCNNPVDQLAALGKQLEVTGTPTMVMPNGKRIVGYVDSKTLEAELARGQAKPANPAE